MNQGREPVEIFPMSLDMSDGIITDFRPVALPADAPEPEQPEEEVTDPKVESVTEPASSQEPELPPTTRPTHPAIPVPPPAPSGGGSPKPPATGSSSS